MNPKGSTISHIFLKTSHGAPMEAVKSATAITGEGLQNDISRGRKLRQILIVDALTIQEFGLSPGALRENIILEGQSLSSAEAGTVIRIGAAKLEVTLGCSPCDFLDDIRPGLQDDLEGRRGTLCRVLDGGVITVGDSVTLSD
jgi:hypothetical protein